MDNYYKLLQRDASTLTEICGINDIVDSGENANGYYCRFANGYQLMFVIQSYEKLPDSASNNSQFYQYIPVPATSLANSGNGSCHTSSMPGQVLACSNITVQETNLYTWYYNPYAAGWAYDSPFSLMFVILSRWR